MIAEPTVKVRGCIVSADYVYTTKCEWFRNDRFLRSETSLSKIVTRRLLQMKNARVCHAI